MTLKYKIIKSEEQYQSYIKRFEQIFDCEEDSPEEIELELLGLIIDKYETKNHPIPESDPVETIKFIMEQNNYKPSDLGRILNSPSRATEILKKQRRLTLNQIRILTKALNIPSDILIKEYELKT